MPPGIDAFALSVPSLPAVLSVPPSGAMAVTVPALLKLSMLAEGLPGLAA